MEVGKEDVERVGREARVGIDANHDLDVGLLDGVVERARLTAIPLREQAHARMAAKGFVEDIVRAIRRAVVDDDDLEVLVPRAKQGLDAVDDDALLVVGRYDDGKARQPTRERGQRLLDARLPVGDEGDDEQPPDAEHDAGHEQELQEAIEGAHQREADAVDVGNDGARIVERRHQLVALQAQQLVDRDEAIAVRTELIDDLRKCRDRLRAVAATVVEKHDIAAPPMGVRDRAPNDLLDARAPPVERVDALADGDVAERSRGEQRARLLRGLGLDIAHERRTEERGADAELRLEHALRCVELEIELSARNLAEVRVRERVVADIVPFVVDALEDLGLHGRGRTQHEEARLDVLFLEDVEDSGRVEARRPIVERERDHLVLVETEAGNQHRLRNRYDRLVRDQVGLGEVRDRALADARLVDELQDLALARVRDLLARIERLECRERGIIRGAAAGERRPDRRVLRAEPP